MRAFCTLPRRGCVSNPLGAACSADFLRKEDRSTYSQIVVAYSFFCVSVAGPFSPLVDLKDKGEKELKARKKRAFSRAFESADGTLIICGSCHCIDKKLFSNTLHLFSDSASIQHKLLQGHLTAR